jgi:hypothetical protein
MSAWLVAWVVHVVGGNPGLSVWSVWSVTCDVCVVGVVGGL